MLKVHSIETFGTHEGPGIRLVVFLQGCYFRCLYCHNPDTQNLFAGNEFSNEQIIEMIKNELPYFGSSNRGGVTFSGGEPTVQAKELIPLCKLIKEMGVNIALDTNGGIDNEDVRKLYDYVDYLLLDIKQINNEKHKLLTGVSNDVVLKMAEFREAQKKAMWFRYVLVPGYTDDEKDLNEFGEHFKNYQFIDRVEILPYHELGVYKYKALGIDYKLNGVQPPTPEAIYKAQDILKKYFKNVFIR